MGSDKFGFVWYIDIVMIFYAILTLQIGKPTQDNEGLWCFVPNSAIEKES
jgi:hypothetical protein